ncbi:MAG: MotA/TolQ/ExbB proton channel family protein [Victivallales bacterium]|jgi:biopolymer transport protein ExbB|nr:MotA/TolQ/ExbB proton channel family protein [Victivallales bacterium]MBT7164384.1 MotA/TolQ/ExbB proton channel family protein [Victivallales bacterium]
MSALLRRTVGCLAFAVFTVSAFAAEAPAAAKGANLTLAEIIGKGGAPMWGIVVLSFVGLFLIVYYLLSIRSGALYPKAFLRQAEDAAAAGDAEALRVICSENESAAARIIGAAAEHVVGDASASYAAIHDAVEDEGARQAGILWQRIQYLMDVAIVAPMVGLFGTVLGMMTAFGGIDDTVSIIDKTRALTGGVGQAMYTTAGGLVVGITAMVVHSIFRGWVHRHIGRLELACSRVIRRFVSQG